MSFSEDFFLEVEFLYRSCLIILVFLNMRTFYQTRCQTTANISYTMTLILFTGRTALSIPLSISLVFFSISQKKALKHSSSFKSKKLNRTSISLFKYWEHQSTTWHVSTFILEYKSYELIKSINSLHTNRKSMLQNRIQAVLYRWVSKRRFFL